MKKYNPFGWKELSDPKESYLLPEDVGYFFPEEAEEKRRLAGGHYAEDFTPLEEFSSESAREFPEYFKGGRVDFHEAMMAAAKKIRDSEEGLGGEEEGPLGWMIDCGVYPTNIVEEEPPLEIFPPEEEIDHELPVGVTCSSRVQEIKIFRRAGLRSRKRGKDTHKSRWRGQMAEFRSLKALTAVIARGNGKRAVTPVKSYPFSPVEF